MHSYATPIHIVRESQPDIPVWCFRPERVTASAKWFRESFSAEPGST